MNKAEQLVKRVRLTDKDLRKLAHEYFTIGNNKSTLQAGHWIGLVKFLLNRQLNKFLNDPGLALIDNEQGIDIPDQVFSSQESKQCGFTKRSFSEAGWRKVIPLTKALKGEGVK